MSLTRLVPVAQVGEGDARERHLNEGRALVAQGPRDAVELHHQAAGALQLWSPKQRFNCTSTETSSGTALAMQWTSSSHFQDCLATS